MFYNYIRFWNTFQYKYIIQIIFYVLKQSHAWVTSKDIYLLFILFFCLFPFYLDFMKLSSPFVVYLIPYAVIFKLNV